MATFILSHWLVWLAVVGYVSWLGTRQRKLLEDVRSIQAQLDER